MATAASNAGIVSATADRMKRIVIRLVVAGSMLAPAGCGKPLIDVICAPAGQCPDVPIQHTAGGG